MPSELQTAFSASQLQRERTQTVIPEKNRKSKKKPKIRHSRKNKKSKTEISSFPQKRESRNPKLQEFIKND
ncbi:hypothetical protein [Neisseria maigaei]|uniref:hypothetical protein n=1 Tax=Neisseria maigaei TaxID=2830651 RepID=UPI002657ED37|nr:hypothetical protein [Neisseria maigaei]